MRVRLFFKGKAKGIELVVPSLNSARRAARKAGLAIEAIVIMRGVK